MKPRPLSAILSALEEFAPRVEGEVDRPVNEIRFDSREIGQGELFVALRGAAADGHRFVRRAVEAGASAVMLEADAQVEGLPAQGGPTVIRVPDTRAALAQAAAAFFGHPSRRLRAVGLTGTNGKTTTTFILEAIARAAGLSPGVVGTVNHRFAGIELPSRNTTPESLELQRLLARMVEAGVDVAFLEVSSHALVTHRVDGLALRVGAFLNLSQDHLDFHGTMEAYAQAKARLFSEVLPASARALGHEVAAAVHVARPWGRRMAQAVPEGVRLIPFDGRVEAAEVDPGALRVAEASLGGEGTRLRLEGAGWPGLSLETPLLGAINVENVVAAVAVARALGIEDGHIAAGLSGLSGVPGRLERVSGVSPGPLMVVDYAHTPEAVERALASLRPLVGGRVAAVLGCGGDRDRGKRPLMARAALEGAELLVATSDNPRSEAPEVIIAQMLDGAPGRGWGGDGWAGWRAGASANSSADTGFQSERLHLEVISRREAIAVAAGLCREGDAVLVAGKGHETYQEVGARRFHMSDVEEARAALSHDAGRRVVETMGWEALAGACGARVEGQAPEAWRDHNAGVTTDTRRAGPGVIFVALVGERFDGHHFLADAVAAGAAALVVAGPEGAAAAARAWGGAPGLTLVVDDTLLALGALATAVVARKRALTPWFTVVAITGSNGKTTTKELTSALLSAWVGLEPWRVHRNPGNHNNLIGVPQTIFELRWGHEVAVLEMGANGFGEILAMTGMADPDVRVLTSIGGAHLEGFGSIDGVLRAKSEMFTRTRPGQVAVVPQGWVGRVPMPEGAEVWTFGAEPEARARVVARVPEGGQEQIDLVLTGVDSRIGAGTLAEASQSERTLSLRSPLMGSHNATNLAAAVAACHGVAAALGARPGSGPVALAEALRLPGGRLAVRPGGAALPGGLVLDDCYNANPTSMEAGLEVLRETATGRGARAVAVLGDMFELGTRAADLHRDVGRAAATKRVDLLVTFGALAAEMAIGAREVRPDLPIISIETLDDAAAAQAAEAVRRAQADASAVVLVKGSRGARMERIVDALTRGAGQEAAS